MRARLSVFKKLNIKYPITLRRLNSLYVTLSPGISKTLRTPVSYTLFERREYYREIHVGLRLTVSSKF